MIRPGITHLPNTMLNSQHFLQQGQQPQSSSSQPHQMAVIQNVPNPNPSIGMGNSQPQNMGGSNPTPAQVYQHQQFAQQRRNQALLNATQNSPGMNPNPSAAPHINGLGHNQGMGFQSSMIPSQGRRTVPQPSLNQPGVNHIPGMHSGQQNMQNMGGIGMSAQGMSHQNMRMSSQQMNVRMPQQQPQSAQMPGQMSPEMTMSLNPRQPHIQGNPGIPSSVPRGQPSQPPLIGNLPQQSLPQSHPGMQPPIHQMNYPNSMTIPHQQPQPQMGQSPHSGSHPQTPANMPMQQPMTDGIPNRRTPDNLYSMPFQNQQFNPGMSHNNRMSTNGQFGFSASTPPDQDLGSGLSNPPVPPSRAGYHLTPAQQYHMQRNNENINPSHFHIASHQPHAPPRPPSLNPQPQPIPLQVSQPSQQSPDHISMNGIPNLQRPQSEPQPGPVRPPSQQAPSRTPHITQPPLPGMQQPPRIPSTMPSNPSGGPPGSSLGPQSAPSQPPSSTQQQIPPNTGPSGQQGHPFSTGAQRQPNQAISAGVPGPPGPPSGNVEASSSQAANANPQKVIIPPIGMGQGIQRLLQFSAVLANENRNKLQLSYWENMIKEYFTPKAVMKYTLWKDNQRNEAKPFEIGVPILPRFFLVTSQSGVKSMNISLDGARERIISPGHAVVECASAVWTYKYNNGYTIHLRGPLTAHVWVVPASPQQGAPQPPSASGSPPLALRFEHLQFDANYHDKYITVDAIVGQKIGKSPHVRNAPTPVMNGIGSHVQQPDGKDDRIHYERASLPAEPVNAFGVPQATMRCLELAESVAQMTDLIQFSTEHNLGPLQSLKQFAKKIRESQGVNGFRMMAGNNSIGGPGFQKDGSFGGKTIPSNPSVTLYHGAPSSSVPLSTHPLMGSNTPQNPSVSGDASSPSKQNKAPPIQQAPSSTTAASSSTPTSTTASTAPNTTPSMAAATLDRKRKATDTASPTTDYPVPKRQTRKRRTTGGG